MNIGNPTQRAILGIVHAVIFSDGEVRAEEAGWVHSKVRRHSSFRNLSDEDWASTFAATMMEWNSAPLKVVLDRWINALAGMTANKQICFELAIDAALADDEVADIERGVLAYLARAWDLSEHYIELAYRGAIERKMNEED
jgi:tellurite resistance protein